MNLFKVLGVKSNRVEGFTGDRRVFKRYEIPLKVTYFEPLTRLEGSTLSRNISSSGIRLPIKTKLPRGTLLNLLVEDPISERSISAKGKVIWVEEFITGDNAEGVRYETGVKLLKKRLF